MQHYRTHTMAMVAYYSADVYQAMSPVLPTSLILYRSITLCVKYL